MDVSAHRPAAARGSVLIISLLVLLVLTILSVTGLSMATMEERMARSFEHGGLAFQGSESAIVRAMDLGTPQAWVDGVIVTRAGYSAKSDPFLAAAASCNGTTNPPPYDADGAGYLKNTSLTSNVTVTYLGERANLPGVSLGMGIVGHEFQIRAATTIGSTSIQAVHDRGIYLIGPENGGCAYAGPPG